MEPEELSGVLTEFARTMVTDFPIQGILDRLVQRIVEVMPISAAGVTLITTGLQPRYVAASDPSALRFEKLQTESVRDPAWRRSRRAARSRPRICAPRPGSRCSPRRPWPRAWRPSSRSRCATPTRSSARWICIEILPGQLVSEHLTAAQTLADVAAAYLINAQGRSDLQDASDQSRDAALHDALTGLPNRVLMLELLEHAFRSSTALRPDVGGVLRRPGPLQGGQRHLRAPDRRRAAGRRRQAARRRVAARRQPRAPLG